MSTKRKRSKALRYERAEYKHPNARRPDMQRVQLLDYLLDRLAQRERENQMEWLTPQRCRELFDHYMNGEMAEPCLTWEQMELFDEDIFTGKNSRLSALDEMPWQIVLRADAVGEDKELAKLAEQQRSYMQNVFARIDNLEDALRALGEADFRAVAAADEFDDGTRDPFTHFMWTERWLKMCHPLLRESGWVMVFTDWRQLPMLATAVQMSGYIWQGIVTWDKVNGRRFNGRFAQQAEYVVVASKGRLPNYLHMVGAPSPANVYTERLAKGEKYHVTAKPVGLMRHLMGVLPQGAHIIDPFAGGGSTLAAARELGHSCVGIEITPQNYDRAAARLGLCPASAL